MAASRALEVFFAFLRLGFTAFGGPVAHLGYFREAFVARRAWLDEASYADLVAVSQFLPGPSSSQVAIGIGLRRAGSLGALAAWIAFALPSAILMTALAYVSITRLGPWGDGLLHGLKLVAVAVVGQAVWGMARSLTPDAPRIGIALIAAAIASFAHTAIGQIAAISLGVVAGILICRRPPATNEPTPDFGITRKAGLAALGLFLALLVGGPLLVVATGDPALARADAFYRSGALVFGGGHVVLPLLQEATVDTGWIDQNTFLAGYGAAQAMPGPLFAFAAYLGATMPGAPTGIAGASLALVAIFLPGVLAFLAAIPFWAAIRTRSSAQAAIRGANAAVVGVLAAALYNPVWVSAVHTWTDIAGAVAGFVLLTFCRTPPLFIVVFGAAFGALSRI